MKNLRGNAYLDSGRAGLHSSCGARLGNSALSSIMRRLVFNRESMEAIDLLSDKLEKVYELQELIKCIQLPKDST